MTEETAARDRCVADVVRDVVSEVCPEELPVAEGLALLGDHAAYRRLTGRPAHDPVGFGVGELVALATPVVWIAVQETVQRLVDPAASSLARRLTGWGRRLLRRPPPPLTVPALAPPQLAEVHRRALELAAGAGLTAERAQALADRIVVALTLPPEQGTDGRPAPG